MYMIIVYIFIYFTNSYPAVADESKGDGMKLVTCTMRQPGKDNSIITLPYRQVAAVGGKNCTCSFISNACLKMWRQHECTWREEG